MAETADLYRSFLQDNGVAPRSADAVGSYLARRVRTRSAMSEAGALLTAAMVTALPPGRDKFTLKTLLSNTSSGEGPQQAAKLPSMPSAGNLTLKRGVVRLEYDRLGTLSAGSVQQVAMAIEKIELCYEKIETAK